jgi:hypothetical protein
MTKSGKSAPIIGDIEKPHPTVADDLGDESGLSVTVRLGDLWSDFIRVANGSRSRRAKRSQSALPLIDEMKGILQWD